MMLERSSILRQLAEIDEQLASDTREALSVKTQNWIRRRLIRTLEKFQEALECHKHIRIVHTVRSLRAVVRKVISGEPISISGEIEDRKVSDVEIDEWFGSIPSRSYLLAFERGARQQLELIDATGAKPVSFTIGLVKIQRTPHALFTTVSRKILGKSANAKGKKLCIYLRDGSTPEEAEQLLISAEQADELSQDYLRAFEKGAGCPLEQMRIDDNTKVTFTVGSETKHRSPQALFFTVARHLLGSPKKARGRQLCILIRDGRTQKKAAEHLKRDPRKRLDRANSIDEVNQAYLRAFEHGAGRPLEQMIKDNKPVNFNVGSVELERRPRTLFFFVSEKLLGKQNDSKGRQLCIFIRDGNTHEEAIRLLEQKRQASEVNQDYLIAFERGAGRSLEQMKCEDYMRVTFTVGSIRQERSPYALFYTVGRSILNNPAPMMGMQLCIHIRDGKSIEEAKRLVELGDEGISDAESDKLSQMNLEEVIAFFRVQQGGEMKLKIYLQFAYPEMSEGEINRIVIRVFKNLYGGKTVTREEEYLGWKERLPQIQLNKGYARETSENTVTLRGIARGSECVHVCGTWSRRVRVESDGTFSVTIPLKIGQSNEIRLMGIDRKRQCRSQQEFASIRQTGTADDIEALVNLLEGMNTELAEQISVDPGRREYLAECMERVVVKKFGQSFAQGEKYIKDLLRRTKKGIVRDTIQHVLAKFQWIESMQLPNVKDGSLMFFQKYCAARIRQAMDQGKAGVNLCNDPGLGKTRTVWAAAGDKRAVVFTPNSVVSVWKTEAHACLADPDLLVLDEPSHAERKQRLRGRTQRRVVTNTKFLQRVEDAERFRLVSDPRGIVIFDEAHSRKNEHSEQSKGARKVKHRFSINVTATLARNPVELRRMLHTLDPGRPEFRNDEAFRRAFPTDDPAALKSLKLLVDQYTIRFRKHEVMEEIDPDQPLEEQLYRLPRKERVSPEDIGRFEMSERQAEAVFELFMDWPAWCRKYGKYIPDDEVNREDGLRTEKGIGFAKLHAYRQIINNPEFIGDHGSVDQKAWQMERMVKKCIKDGRKVVLFCKYEAQALKYAKLLKKYNPSSYTGQMSRQGVMKDAAGQPKRYSVDSDGQYYEDPKGKPMSRLEYEREKFQNDPLSQVLIVTYGAGSVGTTFTAGKAMIYDDLPSDCKEDIQAEDRIHRIDPERQTQASVQYHQMQARYPRRFLESMKKTWVRHKTNKDGRKIPGWEEYWYKSKPEENDEDNPWITAYDAFFRQGTYDQVHSENLVNQRLVFHLINDGMGDESDLMQDQKKFFGIENGLDSD